MSSGRRNDPEVTVCRQAGSKSNTGAWASSVRMFMGCPACACHGTHSPAQGEGFFLREGHSLLLEEGNSVYLGEINFP